MSFVRGQLIADRYCLINLIGEGALGELWRAADRVPDRQVVVRRVAPFGEAATKRMLEELDAARALRDRCVARVHRGGMLDGGQAFVVGELLLSESLHELLERRGRLAPGAALSLVSELARAIATAHERHLAHRAISPRTILLHRDDQGTVTPKLVDFGRAEVLEPLASYASPEQLTGDPDKGYESDLWALGALLFRCVTGIAPFKNLSEAFEAERIVGGADVPALVRDVLLATLNPVRSKRMKAAQLSDACAALARRLSGGLRDVEKMVRIQSPVWLDAAASGAIDHVPTIPNFGGGPPPRASEAPLVARRDGDEGDEVKERELAVPLPQAEPESPPPQQPREPNPEPELLPAARATPIPDDVFVDFRPRRRRRFVVYGSVAAALAFVGGMAIATTTRSHARTPARVVATSRVAPVPNAATPTVATVATVAAVPTIPPKRAVLEPTKTKEPNKEKAAPAEKRVISASPASTIRGVPLWDPKPTKPADDNPYE